MAGEREIVAKRNNASRTRAKARSDDGEPTNATTLTTHQLRLRRQRWRALKKQFDAAHQVGISSLKRRDYDSLHAAMVRERRIIDELRVLIGEARMQVGFKAPPSRR